MPEASFTNVVILNVERDFAGPLEKPAEEISSDLLKIAGIVSNYVLSQREADNLSTQAAVDKEWLLGLVNIPMMRSGPKSTNPSEIEADEPNDTIIGCLTADIGKPNASVVRFLEPRLAAAAENAKALGEGGISAVVLDVRPATTDSGKGLLAQSSLEAVVTYVTVTVTYEAPPAQDPKLPKLKPALPTWSIQCERYGMSFDHDATKGEPARSEWSDFLANAECVDVKKLDTYVEVRIPGMPEIDV